MKKASKGKIIFLLIVSLCIIWLISTLSIMLYINYDMNDTQIWGDFSETEAIEITDKKDLSYDKKLKGLIPNKYLIRKFKYKNINYTIKMYEFSSTTDSCKYSDNAIGRGNYREYDYRLSTDIFTRCRVMVLKSNKVYYFTGGNYISFIEFQRYLNSVFTQNINE